jgi:two-component sensor histidine kinase
MSSAGADNETAVFPPTDDAPYESRSLVRNFLTEHDADDLVDIGLVLTSELVTNVIRHAHSPVQLDLEWQAETLRVEVRDGSSIIPAVAELANADGGFGLRLVDRLAADWGIRQLDDGKAVWFTVRREHPPGDSA